MEEDRSTILKFLKLHTLAVIATSSPRASTPESALIAYVVDDRLCLYFQTSGTSRKAQNLLTNQHASFVIGLEADEMKTLQYEGIANQLTDRREIEACKKLFLEASSPTTREHLEKPVAILFKVTPEWIGYSDYSGERAEVIELEDF